MIRTRPPEYQVYRRAREKALRRLANAYPDQYKQYLEEEKASERANEGGSGITDTAGAGSVGLRSATTLTHTSETSNQGTNQGNNGGEA